MAPARYVVCVGSIPPHKNLARLIKAFLLVRTEFPIWSFGSWAGLLLFMRKIQNCPRC